jgi:diguanylate cyclase (GGDEF)-like protein
MCRQRRRPSRSVAAALLLVCAAAVFTPAASHAASLPVTIDVFGMSGAGVTIDTPGTATVADAAAGRIAFAPTTSFEFPHRAAYLRQLVVWFRLPADARYRTGNVSIETSFDADTATLYVPDGSGGFTATQFGMGVPYADRTVARIVPTARIAARADAPLFLRISYGKESRRLAIVNPAAIAAEDAAANAQEPEGFFLLGVFLTLALTNLVLFAYARTWLYVQYSAAMVLAALNCGTLAYPFAWRWFWPHTSAPHFLVFIGAAALFVTSMVFFTSSLLNVRSFWPHLDRFLRLFALAAAGNGVCTALWYASAQVGSAGVDGVINAAVFIPYAILIVAGVQAWRDGSANAPYVVAGYTCQAVGIAFFVGGIWSTSPETSSGILSGFGLAGDGVLLFAALAARLERAQRKAMEQTRAAEEQRRLAFTDGLTGVANRRAYDDALTREWERSARDGTGLALVMLDVDFFKRYNDTYGHIAGDTCLQRVAAAAGGCVHRPGDLFARYGGEEFAALLPHTSPEAAYAIGEAMCEAVRALRIEHAGSSLAIVSISVGVAGSAAAPFAEPALPHAADEALYRAKEGGRNRVASQASIGPGPEIVGL